MVPVSLIVWIALEVSAWLYIGRHVMHLGVRRAMGCDHLHHQLAQSRELTAQVGVMHRHDVADECAHFVGHRPGQRSHRKGVELRLHGVEVDAGLAARLLEWPLAVTAVVDLMTLEHSGCCGFGEDDVGDGGHW